MGIQSDDTSKTPTTISDTSLDIITLVSKTLTMTYKIFYDNGCPSVKPHLVPLFSSLYSSHSGLSIAFVQIHVAHSHFGKFAHTTTST